MNLKNANAMLVIASSYLDTDGNIIEKKTAYYRSDIYSFELDREL